MKKQTHRKFASAFKAKVAPEAVKDQQTLEELKKKFEVNPVSSLSLESGIPCEYGIGLKYLEAKKKKMITGVITTG